MAAKLFVFMALVAVAFAQLDLKPPFPANKTALNAWAANLPSAKNVSSLRLGAAKAAAVYDGVALAENVKAQAAAVLDNVKAGNWDAAAAEVEAAVEGKGGVLAEKVTAVTQAKGATLGLAAARLAEYKCIKTPAEYIAAFNARDLGRCVDEDLFGRLGTDPNATVSTSNTLSLDKRPAYFWTGADGLAKYLRYGPPKSLGSYWPQTGGPAGWPQDYASPYFAGLQQFSNGQGLVSNIGYGAGDFTVDSVFTLIVVSRSAMAAALATRAPFANTSLITLAAGVSPTWRNARDYFEVAYAEVGLTIPDEVVSVLESNTFVGLTGCPAQCTYHSNIFPSACANRLVYIGTRDSTNINVCNPPTTFEKTSSACTATLNAGGFQLVPPTNIDSTSQYCKPEWLATKAYFDSKGLADCSRDLAKSTAMAQALQEAFTANAGNPTMQALYFRRFLLYGCQGNFNQLNTGNGYTAAGPGGLLAGEATEWLFSPVEIQDVAPGGYATTQFCLGVNGGSLLPGTDFACTDYGNVTP